ncbi:TVP38/TMEM64 family protein [Salinarchaeum laminariae]|uniref:TVP38/TMEM64 family protein n=1 Tax=Salinarchaeum laminariae TaxID=869888 RepID=UPI0020C14B07|nr:VTT domain-containing protein [Salinarchaeum laminariae]
MHRGLRTVTLALVVAGVSLAALLHSPEPLLDAAERAASDPLLFAGVIAVLYAVRPALLWPPTLVAVVVGYGYGVVLGFPIALAGAVATSILPFYVTRWLGTDAPGADRVSAIGEQYLATAGPVRGVTAARLAPIPADAVTVGAALADVRFRSFALGVILGEIPWTIAAVAVGASLATLSTEGATAGGFRLIALTTIAAIAVLVGPAYRRYGERIGLPVGAGSGGGESR